MKMLHKIFLLLFLFSISITTQVEAQMDTQSESLVDSESITSPYLDVTDLTEEVIYAISNNEWELFKKNLSTEEIEFLKKDIRFSGLFSELTTEEVIFSQGVNLDDASRQTGLTKKELLDLEPEEVKEINFTYNPPEAVSCFDYYEFGSVEVNLFNELDTLVYGNEYKFKASVINKNFYPVVETDIYVRLYREQPDEYDSLQNGDHIMGQFLIAENISLDSNEIKEIEFNLLLPEKIKTGQYYMVPYVVSSDRYNMLGLTFTDDISGPKIPLKIKGVSSAIYFDKNSVRKNGKPHSFISFLDTMVRKPILVEVDVVNETTEDTLVEVDWRLYNWDSSDEANKLSSEKLEYEIQANSTKTISYAIDNVEESVYMLSPLISNKYGDNFLNIRMQIYDIDTPRVNYPAVTGYPLQKNKENTFFVCLHNTGTSQFVDDVLFEAVIEDEEGNIIHHYSYDGKVPVGMTGFSDSFIPQENTENFIIKTKLFKDSMLISEDELYYSCDDINSNYCENKKDFKSGLIYLFSLVVIITIVILIIINFRKYE